MLVEMVKDLVLEVSTGWYLIPGSCMNNNTAILSIDMSLSWRWLCPNLVPRVRFPFGQHQEHILWPLPRQEVHKSQTSGMSMHAQKFETTVIVNGYKNGPSLPLPINWK